MASLKTNVSCHPGWTSIPLVTGVPSGRVTDTMRGTMVVVKVQRAAGHLVLAGVGEARSVIV